MVEDSERFEDKHDEDEEHDDDVDRIDNDFVDTISDSDSWLCFPK